MISLLLAELSIDRLHIPVSEQLMYEAAFFDWQNTF
jgi:hypothetical protein